MEKTYRIRIYPTPQQKDIILRTLGAVRFVYNYYLEKRRECNLQGRELPTYIDMVKDLNELKAVYPWLKAVDSRALQNALKHMVLVYKNFFATAYKIKGCSGFPKFKTKKDPSQNYQTTCNCNSIRIKNNYIKLPKLKWVRFRGDMLITGRILNAIVTQEQDGRYYVSLCCTDLERRRLEFTGKRIFLEYGGAECFCRVYELASDDCKVLTESVEIEENLIKAYKKHKRLLRGIEKSKADSRGRVRLLEERQRLEERIKDIQKDFLQQLSARLVHRYDGIKIDRGPKSDDEHYMLWRQLRKMITYKLSWYKS